MKQYTASVFWIHAVCTHPMPAKPGATLLVADRLPTSASRKIHIRAVCTMSLLWPATNMLCGFTVNTSLWPSPRSPIQSTPAPSCSLCLIRVKDHMDVNFHADLIGTAGTWKTVETKCRKKWLVLNYSYLSACLNSQISRKYSEWTKQGYTFLLSYQNYLGCILKLHGPMI